VRRILLVLTVALVMAAMMVASAMPAFADHRGPPPTGETKACTAFFSSPAGSGSVPAAGPGAPFFCEAPF
jgi:hypothetical protein